MAFKRSGVRIPSGPPNLLGPRDIRQISGLCRAALVACTVVAACGLAARLEADKLCPSSAAAIQDAGLLAAWKDGEIRHQYHPESGRTEVFLAWVLSCTHATPTLTFSASFKGKEPTEVPGSFSLRVDLGARNNPNAVRTPTLVFRVDEDVKIDVSSTLRSPGLTEPGAGIETQVGTLDLVDLSRMVTARSVTAEVLGSACSVTQSQLDRLHTFEVAVMPPQIRSRKSVASVRP